MTVTTTTLIILVSKISSSPTDFPRLSSRSTLSRHRQMVLLPASSSSTPTSSATTELFPSRRVHFPNPMPSIGRTDCQSAEVIGSPFGSARRPVRLKASRTAIRSRTRSSLPSSVVSLGRTTIKVRFIVPPLYVKESRVGELTYDVFVQVSFTNDSPRFNRPMPSERPRPRTPTPSSTTTPSARPRVKTSSFTRILPIPSTCSA